MIYTNSSESLETSRGLTPDFLIHWNWFPQYCKIIYYLNVCDIRPQNKDIHQVKFTLDDYNLIYYGPGFTPTSELTT